MYQSHEGLRDDYEVSCKELDILFDFAYKSNAILGARMMGGGFGGCTINIVKQENIESFSEKIKENYLKETGVKLEIYTVKITNGTGLI